MYANVLIDDQTLRTYQLKQKYSAQELFKEANKALKGRNTFQTSHTRHQAQKVTNQPAVRTPPPSLDDDTLPPIPPMTNITPVSASHQNDAESAGLQIQSIDWKAFCKEHGILPGVLKALAQELGLPIGKLNPRQSNLSVFNSQNFKLAMKDHAFSLLQLMQH